MRYLVFYAGLLYGEYDYVSFRNLQVQCPLELYNGGYLYRIQNKDWYRMDLTPLLIEDVPKELQLSVLLLT